MSVYFVSRALCAFLLLLGAAQVRAGTLEQQRQLYVDAMTALQEGDTDTYERNRRRLRGYLLYPYLEYAAMADGLDATDGPEIRRFLETYRDLPLSRRLRSAWLRHLMGQGRWKAFLESWEGSTDVSLQCYALRARIRAGELGGVAKEATALWLSGSSRPEACDRLFAWLERQGKITTELVWERIALAMEAGQTGLARHLSGKLERPDRDMVDLWILAHAEPDRALTDERMDQDTALTRTIALDAVRQQAREDVAAGRMSWQRIRLKYTFPGAERHGMDREIALLSAYRHYPEAMAWLEALPPGAVNEQVRLWSARTALRNGDWERLVVIIPTMETSQRRRQMWRYWLARAYEQTGREKKAGELYRKLSEERDYYGFLAADRIGAAYVMNHKPVAAPRDDMRALADMSGIRRARELLQVDQVSDARAEWNLATRGLDAGELKLAAALASDWGWHEMAIQTAGRSKYYDDLDIRFPAPYRKEIRKAARSNELNPALVYGIIRRESLFGRDARSPAGALGLMQLMPATARQTSARTGLRTEIPADLLTAQPNIDLGSAYISQLLEELDNNLPMAIAAYNAGPSVVSRWRPEDRALPADVWIDTLPYYETRRYLRAVLAFTTIYERKLGLPATRMDEKMPPVPERPSS